MDSISAQSGDTQRLLAMAEGRLAHADARARDAEADAREAQAKLAGAAEALSRATLERDALRDELAGVHEDLQALVRENQVSEVDVGSRVRAKSAMGSSSFARVGERELACCVASRASLVQVVSGELATVAQQRDEVAEDARRLNQRANMAEQLVSGGGGEGGGALREDLPRMRASRVGTCLDASGPDDSQHTTVPCAWAPSYLAASRCAPRRPRWRT